MRAIRLFGNAILWVIAVVGVLSILIFGATKLGYLKPLVVISGSMEPRIMTGDLLFDTPHPTSELEVGDVASIPSALTGKLISHRVVAVTEQDGHYEVNLKGDANESADGETYLVGDTVWRPVLQVPHGGYVVTKLSQPTVALPLGVTLLALLGLTLMPSAAPRRRDERASDGVHEVPADDVDMGEADDEPVVLDRSAELSTTSRP